MNKEVGSPEKEENSKSANFFTGFKGLFKRVIGDTSFSVPTNKEDS